MDATTSSPVLAAPTCCDYSIVSSLRIIITRSEVESLIIPVQYHVVHRHRAISCSLPSHGPRFPFHGPRHSSHLLQIERCKSTAGWRSSVSSPASPIISQLPAERINTCPRKAQLGRARTKIASGRSTSGWEECQAMFHVPVNSNRCHQTSSKLGAG
jgi:hypothetical protein